MKQFLVIFITLISLQTYAQDRVNGGKFATRSEVISQNGMVATSHPLATQIGIDILKQGGNAIDAAIAANAALGLMEPTGSGIGGDLFAIIWSAKDQKLYGLNASGRSPEKLTLQYFKDKKMTKIPSFGPLPVSVPGCVDGWFEMHGKFGTLDMEQILKPAIDYANNGFPVTELIGYYLTGTSRRFKEYPNFADTYMPNGNSLNKGSVFKNPYLANTYDKIGKGGRDAFYKGEVAKTIANFIQEQGGFLSVKDLANHTSEWVEPISSNYRGYDVWELPPNGQGTAALQILNIMEGYNVKEMGFGSAEYIHHFTEAKKLAFEDRAKYYADPAFNKLPVEQLISKEYANERRKLINPNRAARSYDAGELEQGNTIYMTVADKFGNMVSLIQSNYRGMGSGMVPPKLGFMLQDRGELFSLEEGHLNVIEPKKRPFHTIIPAFITKNGKPWVSFGLMGGAMQPQGHAQIVINLIDFEMNLQEAGDAPRMQHNGSSEPTGGKMTDGGQLVLESGIDYQTIRALMSKGHKVGFELGSYGGYQAIMWDEINKVYFGASESRKDGQASGY
ncbi:MAG: gamma-glutamyltransferase [Lutibacter sp.]|uniref:gamma-glutamyltransferase n=1 Tax=Lutibacter sp. TaxID=1925666 RepID=UPI0017C540D7|nr:gamma-glutamyltransferase [Lutibacter sp.]MBT8317354.1 gamma-glutamyltransferase [Lutibacter sp.]NNJ58213.1 gamma-glutamyltransferase [Lutibacter sp.]